MEISDLRSRAERLGRVFNYPPALLLQIKADISGLKSAVESYLKLNPGVTRYGDFSLKTGAEFQWVEAEFFSLLSMTGVFAVQSTVSVRVKPSGDGNYDTGKIHTDIWSGNPPGFVVMIPISGDIEKGGVEFYTPSQGTLESFCKEYPDYSMAPDFCPVYLGRMTEGFISVADAFCLHRTLVGGKRISVDSRILYSEQNSSDLILGSRRQNYRVYDRSA